MSHDNATVRIVDQTSSAEVVEGERFVIECEAASTAGKSLDFEWWKRPVKNDVLIDADSTLTPIRNVIGPKLVFDRVRESNQGFYFCLITDGLISQPVVSNLVYLKVVAKNEFKSGEKVKTISLASHWPSSTTLFREINRKRRMAPASVVKSKRFTEPVFSPHPAGIFSSAFFARVARKIKDEVEMANLKAAVKKVYNVRKHEEVCLDLGEAISAIFATKRPAAKDVLFRHKRPVVRSFSDGTSQTIGRADTIMLRILSAPVAGDMIVAPLLIFEVQNISTPYSMTKVTNYYKWSIIEMKKKIGRYRSSIKACSYAWPCLVAEWGVVGKEFFISMKGVTAYPDGTLGHTGAEPFLCTVMSCLADLATILLQIVEAVGQLYDEMTVFLASTPRFLSPAFHPEDENGKRLQYTGCVSPSLYYASNGKESFIVKFRASIRSRDEKSEFPDVSLQAPVAKTESHPPENPSFAVTIFHKEERVLLADVLVSAKVPAESVRRKILAGLERIVAELHDNKYVHGKFVQESIAVSEDGAVSLVDCNWCGVHGRDAYPEPLVSLVYWPRPYPELLQMIDDNYFLAGFKALLREKWTRTKRKGRKRKSEMAE